MIKKLKKKKNGDGVIFYTLKITLPIFLFDKSQLEPVAEAYGQKGDRFIFYKLKINPLPFPRSVIENFDDFGKSLNENNL